LYATILRGLTGATVEGATLTGLGGLALRVSARGAGQAIAHAILAILIRIADRVPAAAAGAAIIRARRACFSWTAAAVPTNLHALALGSDVGAVESPEPDPCQDAIRAGTIPCGLTAVGIKCTDRIFATGIVTAGFRLSLAACTSLWALPTIGGAFYTGFRWVTHPVATDVLTGFALCVGVVSAELIPQ